MKKSISLMLLLTALCLAAGQSRKMPIALIDLESSGVRESDAKTLTNQLHTELFRTGIFDILERKEMTAVLKEQGFQQGGCVSTECIVEMGQLIGVKQIVAGSIGKLGEKYILNIRMVDVASGRVLATTSEECTCPLENLTSTIEKVALKLSGVERRERITVKFSKGGSLKEKGNLYIKSVPSGAKVFLSGQAVEGNTPLVIEDIPVGDYLIRLHLESGDYAADTLIELHDNEFKTVQSGLSKKLGRLTVLSIAQEADVYLDEKFKGVTPLFLDSLAVGEYKVTIRKQGHVEQSRDVTIECGKETDLEFELKKPGPLKILSIPLEAEIVIDGEARGLTPAVITGLLPGVHKVEIRKEGFVPYLGSVRMSSEEETKIEPALKSPTGFVKEQERPAEDEKEGRVWDRAVKWIIIGTGLAFTATVVAVTLP